MVDELRERQLISRIRKLLRLGQATGPEAEAAMARARELMHRHSLEVSVDDAVRLPVEDVDEQWQQQLLLACAQHHRCRVLQGAERISIFGELRDGEHARNEYRRLSIECLVMSDSAWRAVEAYVPTKFRSRFQRSFLTACSDVLLAKAPAPMKSDSTRKQVEVAKDVTTPEQTNDAQEAEVHFLARRWGTQAGDFFEIRGYELKALPEARP